MANSLNLFHSTSRAQIWGLPGPGKAASLRFPGAQTSRSDWASGPDSVNFLTLAGLRYACAMVYWSVVYLRASYAAIWDWDWDGERSEQACWHGALGAYLQCKSIQVSANLCSSCQPEVKRPTSGHLQQDAADSLEVECLYRLKQTVSGAAGFRKL
ncbi:hypothetical protein K437DRAFT_283630 [Tilletiaria anomala UBC 951]|uniref:Uncharacterized protein n=1 Tax=Tilletiaria anomala (strain ATCC 24038 / CBS 436.72 / UBC 951) TaxID=1037660 RepID=A0A066WFR2_TILAU|nr:uncharacterized protein K437DRAFT_283630 [Tilletiaria anomala UBC 951]KDN49595.1 hypothetical protein K437DRAFT_283630 [Tilletiaria anomala UBC 951]